MRRLLLIAMVLIIGGVVLASAATLDVDGGVLQTFRFDVVLEVPTTTTTLTIEPPAITSPPTP